MAVLILERRVLFYSLSVRVVGVGGVTRVFRDKP